MQNIPGDSNSNAPSVFHHDPRGQHISDEFLAIYSKSRSQQQM
jgi:hypothetical protein